MTILKRLADHPDSGAYHRQWLIKPKGSAIGIYRRRSCIFQRIDAANHSEIIQMSVFIDDQVVQKKHPVHGFFYTRNIQTLTAIASGYSSMAERKFSERTWQFVSDSRPSSSAYFPS